MTNNQLGGVGIFQDQAIKRVIALDPSINSLGWAFFTVEVHRIIDTEELIVSEATLQDSGTIKMPDETKQWLLEKRILGITFSLQRQLEILHHDPPWHYVVIEQPEMWGAYKSVASGHSGSLLGLHITVGALLYWAKTLALEAILIKVSKWKGQLPKKITQQRMEKKYPSVTFLTNDEADAVGLGDYFCTKAIKDYEGANL